MIADLGRLRRILERYLSSKVAAKIVLEYERPVVGPCVPRPEVMAAAAQEVRQRGG